MVTRKDLNEIANTFNQHILLYLKQEEWEKAKAVWSTAEEMYHTMVALNPNVLYEKWRAAILKDVQHLCLLDITERNHNAKS
jgi:hypothetical protein